MLLTKGQLQALILFGAKDAGRFQMHGAHFTAAHAEATDGKIALRIPCEGPENGTIIAQQDLKKVVKNLDKWGSAELSFADFNTATVNGDTVSLEEIVGNYPDVGRAFPKGDPTETVRLSVALLERIVRAAKGIGSDALEFDIVDRKTVVAFRMVRDTGPEVAHGVIMPIVKS